MNKINLRLAIGILSGALAILVQLRLRPMLRGSVTFLNIILGSLPNFLAMFGLSLIFIYFNRPKKKPTLVVVATVVGVVAHEIFTQSTPAGSFGGTFDWNDIIASILGGMCAYLVETKFIKAKHSSR